MLGGYDGANVLDEVPVIPGEAEEPPESVGGARLSPCRDGLDLGTVHGDAVFRNYVAEVGHGGSGKRALETLDMQAVGAQYLEDGTEVFQVFRPRTVVDEDVVEEDQDSTPKERLEHQIHQGLERSGRVGESERHYQEFKVSMMSTERRFEDIVRVYANLVVLGLEIELREQFGTMEFVEELLDDRYGELGP